MREKGQKINEIIESVEYSNFISILRKGFMRTLPILMIGSFAVMLSSFPMQWYLTFINSYYDGFIFNIFNTIYQYTLGCLSLYLIINISLSFSRTLDRRRVGLYPIVALCSYCTFVCKPGSLITADVFSPSWTLTAITITMLSCHIMYELLKRESGASEFNSYRYDVHFSSSIYAIKPAAMVILFFCLINLLASNLFGSTNFQNFFAYIFEKMFSKVGRNYGGSFIFVLFSQIMWFFGIHGNNVLHNVATELFETGISLNQSLIVVGKAPTEIYSKTFLDVFVSMGGCGTAICILLAILIVSKDKSSKRLARSSALPILFNISETLVYGLPVIFSPIMFIPFIVTPLVVLSTSVLAVKLGIVPITINQITWTTPVFMGGYLATGSVAGGFLQIFNIAIGTMIYIPFIKYLEKPHNNMLKHNIGELTGLVQSDEKCGKITDLLNGNKNINISAQKLLTDMYESIDKKELQLFYQPQVDFENNVIGAEGLLRWNHPVCGFIYPPLIIRLASEDGFLDELGYKIIEQSCADLELLAKNGASNFKMSVNISPLQLNAPDFCEKIGKIIRKYNFGTCSLALEVTERVALASTPYIENTLDEIRSLGIDIIMDDFGMGHSSMAYMQNNKFSYVKLDEALVTDITNNERSKSIVSAVCELSSKLNFDIIAEHVETSEQRDILYSLGCKIYQGYLYSKAIPIYDIIGYVNEHKKADTTVNIH